MASADNSKKAAPGRPFKKGVSGNPGGRKKKSVQWDKAAAALEEALPRVMLMEKNKLQNLLQSNPTGAEMVAAKYIHEHIPDVVNRFLGKTPNVVTGAEGAPLIPAAPAPILPPISFVGWTVEQIDRFIEATMPPAGAQKPA